MEPEDNILGKLTRAHSHTDTDLISSQTGAWCEQIKNLKHQLRKLKDVTPNDQIIFEYTIPRMGKRVDTVLLLNGVIFILEYKIGSDNYDRHSKDQVQDYALDLKNFHEGSFNRNIVPILIASEAQKQEKCIEWYDDDTAEPLLCNGANLASLIANILSSTRSRERMAGGHSNANITSWSESGYKPTPTIIEAARALYRGHGVEDIARSDACAYNLSATSKSIESIIQHSRENGEKSICFVTGVPGAGKTLAGLNISTRAAIDGSTKHAVFLSGNGPLVSVLREALARDHSENNGIGKKEALRKVSGFIQNIHHFRDEHLKTDSPPYEHVVIFDEAQRAWNIAQTEKFMVQKRGISLQMSEPEFLISIMNRRSDWATIVCLIGEGQEINTGEGGLLEWVDALNKKFSHWKLYHPETLREKVHNRGKGCPDVLDGINTTVKSGIGV